MLKNNKEFQSNIDHGNLLFLLQNVRILLLCSKSCMLWSNIELVVRWSIDRGCIDLFEIATTNFLKMI